jgi:predicted transcriptional regulator
MPRSVRTLHEGVRKGKSPVLNPLAPLEFAIMRGLWKAKSITAVELTAALNRDRVEPLSAKTTLTCLTRLEAKGLVSHIKSDRAFVFSATKTELELSKWFIGERFRPVIDRYGNLAVAVFVEQVGENPSRYRYLQEIVEGCDEGGHS